MGAGGGAPGTTTSRTGPLPELLPAHMSLLDSAFAAARQAAGQAPNYQRSTPVFYNPGQTMFSPYSMGFTQQPGQVSAPGYWPVAGQAPGGQQQQGGQQGLPFRNFFGGEGQGQQQAQRGAANLGAGAQPIPPGQVPGGSSAGGYPITIPTPLTQVAGEPIVGQQFPGPFIAPANLLELQSLAAREQVGNELAGIGTNVMDLGQLTALGGFLNAGANPYLQSAMSAAIQPQIDAYERVFAPQLASQAIQSGAYKGSSARQFADQALIQDVASNIQNTVAQMAFQNYAQERELQQQAPLLIDAAARLQQLSPEILGQVGAGIRGLEQQQIDDALLRLQEQIEAPFRPLMPLASILYGGDVGSTGTLTTPQPSAALQGIAGAFGGASLGSQIGQQVGYPNWGTGIGATLGGLGSYFAA